MNSPRYAPAGLLVESESARVMIDGGADAEPGGRLDAWLVTDERGELIREIRKLAHARELKPEAADYSAGDLSIERHRVAHTSHPTYGFTIKARGRKVVWAPEFFKFPSWAEESDLMFAEASSWNRPIYFRGGVGGHACVIDVAEQAERRGVKRLVFAHIGRPTIKAINAGKRPRFGEFGEDGDVYLIGKAGKIRKGRSAR
jgi:ribonuclease BN (tRNA processing enzyme)